MRILTTKIMLGLAILCLALPTSAQKKAGKAKKEKSESYTVVKVDQDYRVCTKSEAKDLKKNLDADYKKAVEDYNNRKSQAKKNKAKFTEAKPKKAKLKTVKAGLKSKEAAEEYVAKLREKDAKKAAGKRSKKDKEEPSKKGDGGDNPRKKRRGDRPKKGSGDDPGKKGDGDKDFNRAA